MNSCLVISDTHFHSHPTFGGDRVSDGTSIYEELEGDSRFPGANQRAIQLFNAVERVIFYAERKGIQSILHLGDMFHTKGSVPLAVFNGATKVFAEARKRGITVYAIPGNHDLIGKSPNWSSLNTLYSLPNIDATFAPTVVVIPAGDFRLAALMVPYMPKREVILAEIKRLSKTVAKMLEIGEATHSGLFMHVSVDGATTGPHEYVMREGLKIRDIPFDNFDLIMSGHVHKRQTLTLNSYKFYYCGALAQHNFGERDYIPTFTRLDFAKGSIGVAAIENKVTPRFDDVYCETREQFEALVKASKESPAVECYLRIRWGGDVFPSDVEVPSDRIVVERVPKQIVKPRVQFDLLKESPEELVSRYVKETAPDREDQVELEELGLHFLQQGGV
jgi:DNA repair exonuclease SbcCD nuclease subunit